MKPSEYLHSVFDLEDKVAVVIGGTGELCGAMAEGLAAAGAITVIVGRSLEKATAVLQKLKLLGAAPTLNKWTLIQKLPSKNCLIMCLRNQVRLTSL